MVEHAVAEGAGFTDGFVQFRGGVLIHDITPHLDVEADHAALKDARKVAMGAVFLASDESPCCTGSVLSIDGAYACV